MKRAKIYYVKKKRFNVAIYENNTKLVNFDDATEKHTRT